MDYTGIYTHQLPICVPQLQLGAGQLPLRALELPDHVAWAVPRRMKIRMRTRGIPP